MKWSCLHLLYKYVVVEMGSFWVRHYQFTFHWARVNIVILAVVTLLWRQFLHNVLSKRVFTVASQRRIDHYNENYTAYDDTVKPVPNEEEALQYTEQLPLEEEEQQMLLPRFSGKDDTREW